MKYRYQLILLGSIEDSIVEEIKAQIILEITNLKLPEGILNIIDRSNWEEDYVGNQPTFSIYFGCCFPVFLDYIRCEGIGTERYVHFG